MAQPWYRRSVATRHHVGVASEIWPSNPSAARALVALVADDIHGLDDDDRDALLGEFLGAAWPTPRCQQQ
jgi:hypothetical protein